MLVATIVFVSYVYIVYAIRIEANYSLSECHVYVSGILKAKMQKSLAKWTSFAHIEARVLCE